MTTALAAGTAMAAEAAEAPVTLGEYQQALRAAMDVIDSMKRMLETDHSHGPDLAQAEKDWASLVAQLQAELLTDSAAHALAYLATRLAALYRQQIARLKGELDGYQGRTVYHCMDRNMTGMSVLLLESGEAQEGTVLRATDTSRELVLSAGCWVPRDQ